MGGIVRDINSGQHIESNCLEVAVEPHFFGQKPVFVVIVVVVVVVVLKIGFWPFWGTWGRARGAKF